MKLLFIFLTILALSNAETVPYDKKIHGPVTDVTKLKGCL